MNDPTRIELARAPAAAGSAAAPPAAAASAPGFQALLERLQRLAAPRSSEPPVDAESLRASLAAADESFTTAMDLRRQLEEAFRRHAP